MTDFTVIPAGHLAKDWEIKVTETTAEALSRFTSRHGLGDDVLLAFGTASFPCRVVGVTFIEGKVLYDLKCDEGYATMIGVDSCLVRPAHIPGATP